MDHARPARPTPIWTSLLAGGLLMTGAWERRPEKPAADRNRVTGTSDASNDRGRSADTPAEIPAPGWKDIVFRIYQDIGDDRIVAIAAGVTFFVLLALF